MIESGSMIAIQAQAYYVHGLPTYFIIISPQGILASEVYKGNFLALFYDNHGSCVDLNKEKYKPGWKKYEPVDRVYIKYHQKNSIMKIFYLTRYRRNSRHLQVLFLLQMRITTL